MSYIEFSVFFESGFEEYDGCVEVVCLCCLNVFVECFDGVVFGCGFWIDIIVVGSCWSCCCGGLGCGLRFYFEVFVCVFVSGDFDVVY